jgi:membrane protease subunit (stomatin/prohibitin family)
VIGSSGIPVLDMAGNTHDLGRMMAEAISGTIDQYGLELPELYIENISLPPAVEAALDKRTSMGVVGDLNKYTQFSAAEAMTAAASNPGGGEAAAGMGLGMGMAMANQMANAMNQGGQQQPAQGGGAAVPPPPPVEHVWHLAENGQTTGPFSKADLGRMASAGQLKRETYVWTAGQDGWKKAEDVAELAQLFTVMPPPPPPGI